MQDRRENVTPGSAGELGSGVAKKRSKDISCSIELLDPNEYTASDFQSKPAHPDSGNHNDVLPPPRTQMHDPDAQHFDSHHEYSLDKSQISYSKHDDKKMEGGDDDGDEASVVDIKLMQCESCKRSFAPKVYAKHFDSEGQPKCAGTDKKRKVFNSAKARIANNSNLNKDEQMQVLGENKKVTKELKKRMNGKASKKKSKKGSKWLKESNDFREAMKTNRLISKAEREGKPAHYYL